MGAALYIALEKEIPGVDAIIDGKMLSRAEKHLAETAKRLRVRPLMEFFSVSPDEAAGLLEGEGADVEIPAEQWFSAEEGLRTVQALLHKVDSSSESKAAKDDLLGCERVFQEAQKRGVKWHLAVDF
jgi:hypothetical protein